MRSLPHRRRPSRPHEKIFALTENKVGAKFFSSLSLDCCLLVRGMKISAQAQALALHTKNKIVGATPISRRRRAEKKPVGRNQRAPGQTENPVTAV